MSFILKIRPLRLRYWRSRGFTQIEILIIIFIIGIMAAIAAPSLGGMLEAARMKQATVELRSAFQETQRYSIRKNTTCDTQVFIPASSSQGSQIQGSCLSERELPKGIGISTNVIPNETISDDSGSSDSVGSQSPTIHHAGILSDIYCYHYPSRCGQDDSNSLFRKDINVNIGFGRLGSANFNIMTNRGNSTSHEHSAKFVSFRPSKQEGTKSCVVLSRSLGLTRIGTYQGSLNPEDMTATGECKVAAWTDQ